jgi:hypothetical protein
MWTKNTVPLKKFTDMTVAPPTLSKQQSKLPSSMRYERVQDILENEPAFRARISPKTHLVESRFGEKIAFSKEAVDITEALHAEGKDAHKVPKSDVLHMAARIFRIIATNGDTTHTAATTAPATLAAAAAPVQSVVKPTVKLAEPTKKKKTKAKATAPKPKSEPIQAKAKVKKSEPKTQQTEPKAARLTKPETAQVMVEDQLPESELPPERQPLRLPRDFDPSKFPHYSVQSSIYALLLSAMGLSEHYERYPEKEARQKKLEEIMKDYLSTCNSLSLKTT